MTIIPPKDELWSSPDNKIFDVPLVLTDGTSQMYVLVRDLPGDLEGFLLTGKKGGSEFHVFSEEQEKAMASHWSQLGLEVEYRSQKVEHMHCLVAIKYLCVRCPETDTSISLVPWFMIPGRRFPVFVYLYAIWHYHSTGKKSLSESARAAGKLFGIEKLNKSTVSRNIRAMEGFIDAAQIDRPLATREPKMAPSQDIAGDVPEILKSPRPLESLRGACGEAAKQIPAPVNRRRTISRLLSGIPEEHSKVIVADGPAGGSARDARTRPARPRSKAHNRVQRPVAFVGRREIEAVRTAFIGVSRSLALDAAAACHRFLV